MQETMTHTNSTKEDEIILTERAADEIRSIKEKNNIAGQYMVRLAVKMGGCSCSKYALAFDDAINENDVVVEKHGVKIVTDQKSMSFFSGSTIDFTEGLSGRGFVFSNPNDTKTCGCEH